MKRYGADRDKEIQRLLQEMPEEGFRLLFDVYHMQLCVYVVQLTDSFQLAEDISLSLSGKENIIAPLPAIFVVICILPYIMQHWLF